MAPYRGPPLSDLREQYIREQIISGMFARVIDGTSGVIFECEPKQPEQQEQRIWEIDSDEEEREEKKRAKTKRKYQRKKEKAQAEKAELQQLKAQEKDTTSDDLAAVSVHDVPTVVTDEHNSSIDAYNTTAPSQPKLSKRQKKTLLKKTKQAQAAIQTPEPGQSSDASDVASGSSHVKPKTTKDDEKEKGEKTEYGVHKMQDSKPQGREEAVATDAEMEAVTETIAKRFGQ